jgi:hypothetical protein
VPSYLEELAARRERTIRLFDLYNDSRFDELLGFFDDDIVSCMPDRFDVSVPKTIFTQGKLAYLEQLREARTRYGRMSVLDVFPVGLESSVTFRDESGNVGTFSIGLSEDGRVVRIFYHHRQPERAAA